MVIAFGIVMGLVLLFVAALLEVSTSTAALFVRAFLLLSRELIRIFFEVDWLYYIVCDEEAQRWLLELRGKRCWDLLDLDEFLEKLVCGEANALQYRDSLSIVHLPCFPYLYL